mmetsp:Transcript_19796/g.54566  ORF Transcript_19796/g.54566 Transcript_19796/m.54566 type:complete len:235 (-) Transcript_19796:377-1081(-)
MNGERQIGQNNFRARTTLAQLAQSAVWPQTMLRVFAGSVKQMQHNSSAAQSKAARASGPCRTARRSRASLLWRCSAVSVSRRQRSVLTKLGLKSAVSTAPCNSQAKADLRQRPKRSATKASQPARTCSAVMVTSAKAMKTTGARKRKPMRRMETSWCLLPILALTAACNALNGRDNVLVANKALGGAACTTSANTAVLIAMLSGTASTTMSASWTASRILDAQRTDDGPTEGPW